MQTKSMILARCTHAMAHIRADNSLLVCGGFNGEVQTSAERYSIDEDCWTKAKPMTHARFMHALVSTDPS